MKASDFLCPELVSTDTDDDNNDDDLTAAAGSEYESRMHTTTATPTFSASRVEAARRLHSTTKLYQQPSEALVQQLAVPERRTNGTDPMKRVQTAMYSKKRAGGSFRGNTYFPPWKIRDLDPRLHAI